MSNSPDSLTSVLTSHYCSKHIQFQPFTPKDIVRISEVEVNATELYKNHDNGLRTTAIGGALDGRMVCLPQAGFGTLQLIKMTIGTQRERRKVLDLWRGSCEMCRSLWIHQARSSSLPHRLLSSHHQHASMHLQGMSAFC